MLPPVLEEVRAWPSPSTCPAHHSACWSPVGEAWVLRTPNQSVLKAPLPCWAGVTSRGHCNSRGSPCSRKPSGYGSAVGTSVCTLLACVSCFIPTGVAFLPLHLAVHLISMTGASGLLGRPARTAGCPRPLWLSCCTLGEVLLPSLMALLGVRAVTAQPCWMCQGYRRIFSICGNIMVLK